MNPLFGRLESVIKGAVSVIALVPGIALMFNAVTLPTELEGLLGGLALALGTVIVFGIVLNRGPIRRTRPQRIAAIAAVLATTGLAATVFFFNFVDRHLIAIKRPEADPVYLLKPLDPSAELLALLDAVDGSWAEAILNPGIGHQVRELMRAEAGTAVWLLAALLLSAQALLLTAIILAAWKAAERLKPIPTDTD